MVKLTIECEHLGELESMMERFGEVELQALYTQTVGAQKEELNNLQSDYTELSDRHSRLVIEVHELRKCTPKAYARPQHGDDLFVPITRELLDELERCTPDGRVCQLMRQWKTQRESIEKSLDERTEIVRKAKRLLPLLAKFGLNDADINEMRVIARELSG